jgi:SAM-dependent methyltransferase
MKLSFRDLKTRADVDQWLNRINNDRPERYEVMQHIGQQIAALPFPRPQVVELGLGPGLLAEVLLARLPQITYTGLDFSEVLLACARARLARFADRVEIIRTDLNQDGWTMQLSARPQAMISMQSLHDLGGEGEVNRIYRLARELLGPGGLFLNADLTVPPGQDLPDNPGRRSVSRHLELLTSHGYERVACTLQVADFGCFVAFTPTSNP